MARKIETQVTTPYSELTLDTAWHGNSYGNYGVVYIGEGANRKQLVRQERTLVSAGSRGYLFRQAEWLVSSGANAFDTFDVDQILQEQGKTIVGIDKMISNRAITSNDARPIIAGAEKITGQLRAVRTARILREARLLQEFIQEKGPWVQVYSERFHLNPEEIGNQGGLVRSRLLRLADVHIEAPEDPAADVLPAVAALFRDEAGTIGTFAPEDPIELFGQLTPYAD